MRRMFLKIFAVALLMNLAAYAQSLGEIARQYREQQNAQEASGVQPKVITNKDLGEGPDGSPEARQPQRAMVSAANGSAFDRRFAEIDHNSEQQFLQEQRAGEQWKSQIREQASRVENLQARIDQINASIRFGGGSAQGPYNRYQGRKMERLAQMQLQLDEQRRKLDQMQESARRAGMHTQVYDP
jgi:predicted RNase H-like nuclease (RuvC/YqgF family)